MVKTDFQILITGILVTFILLLADIPATVSKVNEIAASFEEFKKESIFKEIDALKENESYFWARIKGVKIEKKAKVSDEAKQESDSATQETENSDQPAQTTGTNNTANTTTEVKGTETQSDKIVAPTKFLLVGDSMILVGFGPSLESKLLTYKDFSVVREGQYSTGLNRVDYYDWFDKTDKLIAQHKPDVLVVMFGANDGQPIKDTNGASYKLDNKKWDSVYTQRVDQYLTAVSSKVKRVYWVGHPIPKTGTSTDVYGFYNKFFRMNKIYMTEIQKFSNVEYVDAWSRFAVDGKYSATLADDKGLTQLVKQSDGVHVTNHGGHILADFVIKNMDEIGFEKK